MLTQFWFRPILHYRRIKRRVASDLKWYAESHHFDYNNKLLSEKARDRIETVRRNSAELMACFNDDLPPWYRLLLVRRRESPAEASKHLMALSNIRNHAHAKMRLEKIKASLRL